MFKKRNLIGVTTLIVVIALAVVFYVFYVGKANGYSVVYLSTGEVYIGKLSLPSWELKEAYLFQVGKDPANPEKSNFQLNPIKDALWAPKSMHLVKEHVVFFGPLENESQIAKTLATQGK